MASLWNILKEEVLGTVDDFRQKGALGALRDAALDTKDMALDASGWLVDGVKGLVNTNEESGIQAYLMGPAVPKRGTTARLCFADGKILEAAVVDVDGVSEPPRARVVAPSLEQPLLVPILDPAQVEQMRISGTAGQNSIGTAGMSVLEGLKQELSNTVQEFREKGAVGAMKDAALDAVDIVGSTARTAVGSARSLAEPTVQDFREKGAVCAMKGVALDAVGIVGSTAKTAVDGAKSIAAPLIDLGWTNEADSEAPTATAAPEQAVGSSGDVDTAHNSGALFQGLKQEWESTVQDFREKGAVGAVKDAALDAVDLVGSTAATVKDAARDAVDIVGSTANTVIHGARSISGPLLEQVQGKLPDLWADSGVTASGSQEGSPTQTPAVAPAEESRAPAAQRTKREDVSAQTSAQSEGSCPSASAAPTDDGAEVGSSTAASPAGTSSPVESSHSTARAEEPAEPRQAPGSADAQQPRCVTTPKAKEPVPESEMPGGKTGRRSLVSMRRNMFEKPKQEEAKKEAEELID
mmetsp:Transcript_67547/g.156784  ORF Transcript_67547/g.156784 Transcript_67547/m.156784 type:complete len:524 (-) Transcript_67547:168-1739(-)|eukprot:CAMPEP_0171093336 /NCGR_PEP_ID=MMETSP0766_2-20121228/39016_1 /TAXON_ID=439317 /ORGANISM="Gambierdiscus australes, Strain CAWD 149" /LENGTH=523 /DNA_ID=CAMNT_0011551767 /DNA_START=139 /DNA_END=1710 /DNA_ORIENTATION=-